MKSLAVLFCVGLLAVVSVDSTYVEGGWRVDDPWLRSELFFGMSITYGREVTEYVTDEQFSAFINEIVVPLFPDGMTLVESEGRRWDNATDSVYSEPSRMLILYHPDAEDVHARLEAIWTEYTVRFDQWSVLQSSNYEQVCFNGVIGGEWCTGGELGSPYIQHKFDEVSDLRSDFESVIAALERRIAQLEAAAGNDKGKAKDKH